MNERTNAFLDSRRFDSSNIHLSTSLLCHLLIVLEIFNLGIYSYVFRMGSSNTDKEAPNVPNWPSRDGLKKTEASAERVLYPKLWSE
jgi:hypothetical protein